MLNRHARGFFTALFTPLARWLLKIGISPDAVTVVGTVGVVAGALGFYPLGQLWWGTLFITAFIFSDVLDGIMARMRDTGGRWGNFLDSTLDRIADGTYRRCAGCGVDIPVERLELRPSAAGCVACQASAR